MALKPNMDYRIDAGAEGYSHYYITHEETVEILLSKQLGLTISVYDALEQMPTRRELSISMAALPVTGAEALKVQSWNVAIWPVMEPSL